MMEVGFVIWSQVPAEVSPSPPGKVGNGRFLPRWLLFKKTLSGFHGIVRPASGWLAFDP